MLSEKQHIDDFFRQKEEAFTPDEQHVAAHWQQMQQQMADAGPASVNHKNGSHIIRHIGKYLGGLLTVVIIAILAINLNRSNKKAISKTTKQQATIVTAQPAPATNQNTPLVLTPATKQPAANVISETTPVNKNRQLDIAMTLISPPVTKGQPVAVSTDSMEVNTNEPGRSKPNETKTPNPNAQALLRSFFDQLKKEEQAFYIQANRDTTLYAKEGTRLVIPANGFTAKTGPVKGTVKIIMREYIRYEDIIANQLTTTSNEEQLITGGMLHISAQQDGQPVTITPQKAIAVSIPTNNFDNQMMLFTAIDSLNWLPKEAFHQWSDWPLRTTRTINLNTVEPVSVNYGKKTTAKFYLNREIEITKSEIILQLKERFGSYYDNIKIKRVRPQKVKYRSANGDYIIIDTVDIDPDIAFQKKIKRSQNLLSDTLKRNSFGNEKQLKQQEEYRFTIDDLGWINCDRFWNNTRPKINFTVNLGNEITFNDCFQQLVFIRYQSVLYPNFGFRHTVQYKRLPEGEPAVLVTVAVRDGKIVSSFVPLNITNKEIGNLVFEPTTPELFKQKLQSLSASTNK
jgi:hypothetical protein